MTVTVAQNQQKNEYIINITTPVLSSDITELREYLKEATMHTYASLVINGDKKHSTHHAETILESITEVLPNSNIKSLEVRGLNLIGENLVLSDGRFASFVTEELIKATQLEKLIFDNNCLNTHAIEGLVKLAYLKNLTLKVDNNSLYDEAYTEQPALYRLLSLIKPDEHTIVDLDISELSIWHQKLFSQAFFITKNYQDIKKDIQNITTPEIKNYLSHICDTQFEVEVEREFGEANINPTQKKYIDLFIQISGNLPTSAQLNDTNVINNPLTLIFNLFLNNPKEALPGLNNHLLKNFAKVRKDTFEQMVKSKLEQESATNFRKLYENSALQAVINCSTTIFKKEVTKTEQKVQTWMLDSLYRPTSTRKPAAIPEENVQDPKLKLNGTEKGLQY